METPTCSPKRQESEPEPSAHTAARCSHIMEISPGKLVKMRGDSISQINQWYDLLEKGAISKEQYNTLQKAIMNDIFTNFKPSTT